MKRKFEWNTFSRAEYDKFINNYNRLSFQQTSQMGDMRTKAGVEIFYVGVKENDKIIAACLLADTGGKFHAFDILYGPNLDYSDTELLSFFTAEIRKFIKKRGGVYLRINPNILYTLRNSNGEVVDKKRDDLINLIKNTGYIHRGFTTTIDSLTLRWYYAKDLMYNSENRLLSKDELWNTFRKSLQNRIIKAQKYGITLRNLDYSELYEFKKVTENTGIRRNFGDRSLEYYQRFYEAFGDKAQFRIAEFNISDYLLNLTLERDTWQNKTNVLHLPQNKKQESQLRNAMEIRDALQRRIDEAAIWKRDNEEETAIIAVALFVQNEREMVYYLSGMIDEYRNLFAPHLLQFDMLNQCLEKGISKYNFYGIDGIFDNTSPNAGILEFKQGFGGYVEELVGEFDLPVRKVLYKIYSFLSNR